MAWNQEKVNHTYQQVQNLSKTDAKFRSELLQNPMVAIAKIADEPLPESYKIKVIENDPAYMATFVLPPFEYGELSDDDLENIAGGMTYDAHGSCSSQTCGAYVLK